MMIFTNNFSNYILSQINISYIGNLILFSLMVGVISIGFLILLSAKEGLKRLGKALTGLGVAGSIYTGGKEGYKDFKEYLKTSGDNSENKSGNNSGDNSGNNSGDKSENKSGNNSNNSNSKLDSSSSNNQGK